MTSYGALKAQRLVLRLAAELDRAPKPSNVPGAPLTGNRARHPLTAAVPANITPCAFWKDRPADPPVRITDRGPADIMVIQNLRDPATPCFGTKKTRAAPGQRARMVTVDHDGHGAYLANGNACGNRAVTAFLRDGRRARQDVYCAG
ncbi:alpha/beta hydrolase [Streptomyces sp. A1-5]|uniref:alpha/beta hydrolase n=1 Tax=Streptomyces sp. A1-5 TaxID=2738410 RepID=UPI003FA6C508|nr:alpha/beta hydrolase [Streptomyces sp. A1-5]